MVDISFDSAGQFKGIVGGGNTLSNPTVLQFGPDGRLYVSEQDGTLNAFTITRQDGTYRATAVEEIDLIKQIQNHNDDGTLSDLSDRQVTGLVVTGTADNPVLYVSSSDPRISSNGEANADTNSGVITQLTYRSGQWSAVDIVRGLPRSEQSHATNGLALSPDGKKLYVAQGGNTNNGAPSRFFSYANEYALSGTILEIDLRSIAGRRVRTDPAGGQNGRARQYVYDLPTLDDPTTANNGGRENARGRDTNGPWGGNDGFNMSILPANAPLRIYADGFRNPYDLVVTDSGQVYTVDNGSNDGNGGDPLTDSDGLATSQPNNGGTGNGEPLFLVEDGGYYGHPNPVRSNQSLAWTVYNDRGNPDDGLSPNTVTDLSTRVPDNVRIADGFLIDPSKFTRNADRLRQSGVRIPYDSPLSASLAILGSSSNGLVEYTSDVFDGALQGALLVAQFNGSVTLLNVNDAGTDLEPLIAPGDDGVLGTADDVTVDEDGIYPLLSGFSTALDVTTGPDGSIWVAEVGGDFIKAFSPADILPPGGQPSLSDDFDGDGIKNKVDPFIRDASNGTSVTLLPNQTLLWDFDANQDNNLPGPDGYGGGLTGVMVNGRTDFEAFFRSSSDLPNQEIKLDNVKFLTAAGGGTTVVENVSNGKVLRRNTSGEYLFHTGVSIDPGVDEFTVKWTVVNPGDTLSGADQQIGGYLGTGTQDSYLKLVASQSPRGEIELLLEDRDIVKSQTFIQADDLFDVAESSNRKISLELTIDPITGMAAPVVNYETASGETTTVSGEAINLQRSAVYRAITGRHKVRGERSGLAVGLFSTNAGQPENRTFQAIFDDIEITAGASSRVAALADPIQAAVQPSQLDIAGSGNATATIASQPFDPMF